ncbi:DUF3313 domain-containing protein [Candidatus Binatia bacterium]|nr:DUF3313 domain-containing protein [Candidatus Binatia bacterium]
MSRALAIALGLAVLAGCSARQDKPAPAAATADASGFLDDYSALRAGGPDDVLLVYRDPNADWQAYDKVLLEPVTLWRSGKKSLAPISEDDLLRLANDFEAAVRQRLGASFPVVDTPGPGVLLVRLGITEARASDPVLDVLTATGASGEPATQKDGPLSPELQTFIASAAIEGELRDATTGLLLAQGVDRRRAGAPPIDTWGDLERVFARWADRVCSGLATRTGRDS